MDEKSRDASSWAAALSRWGAIALFTLVAYVLSSGPVLALGFWLREATGIDAFYLVMWLYLPLLLFGHNQPISWYIEWWVVDIFHTVGPG